MSVLPPTLKHATRNPAVTGECAVKVFTELHEDGLNTVEFKAVKPWHIAELLRVDIRSVQRALLHLEDLGYVERGERNGNGYTFRLSMPSAVRTPPPNSNAA